MRACCCGLEALNETVSPAVIHPDKAAQAATVAKMRTLKSPKERYHASATDARVQEKFALKAFGSSIKRSKERPVTAMQPAPSAGQALGALQQACRWLSTVIRCSRTVSRGPQDAPPATVRRCPSRAGIAVIEAGLETQLGPVCGQAGRARGRIGLQRPNGRGASRNLNAICALRRGLGGRQQARTEHIDRKDVCDPIGCRIR